MQATDLACRTLFITVLASSTILLTGIAYWKTAARTKPAAFATITVNTTLDVAANDGLCSLREAITSANTNTASGAAAGECVAGVPGLDSIVFNLGAGTPTIYVVSALPAITTPVSIIGNTGGATRVGLHGQISSGTSPGLNLIGGGSSIQALVIGNFKGDGIKISDIGGNQIINCYIGADSSGEFFDGNNGEGIQIENSPNNIIGGSTISERNIIVSNRMNGVLVRGISARNNKIIGNHVGTSLSGLKVMSNDQDGIKILNAPNNTIGGSTPEERNLVSGNNGYGISINGGDSSGNTVSGNYIGADINGISSIRGNFLDGIRIQDAPNNKIGGTFGGESNIIISNLGAGITINGVGAFGNKVSGNYVGLSVGNSLQNVLENELDAIRIQDAPKNVIGGLSVSEKNVIRYFPFRAGVAITGATAKGNVVINNSIYGIFDQGKSIDLNADGITPNDVLDADDGPNGLQNYPELTCAFKTDAGTNVIGSLHSLPVTTFRIDFYATFISYPEGEGERFLGTKSIMTDANGNASIAAILRQTDRLITATATRLDNSGNAVETSEFAARRSVYFPTIYIGPDRTILEGDNGIQDVSFLVSLNGLYPCNTITVDYYTVDGTATGGADYIAVPPTKLIFNPGESTKPITVKVIGDKLHEPLESFSIRLANATNAVIATLSNEPGSPQVEGRVSILDDDYVSAMLSDPLTCVSAGDVVNGQIEILNESPNSIFLASATLHQLSGLPGTCVVTGALPGATCIVSANNLSAFGIPLANETVRLRFQGRLANIANGEKATLIALGVLGSVTSRAIAELTANCSAAGPGALFSGQSTNDQKPGSILVYPIYSSSASNASTQNTRIAVTNTNASRTAYIHLFFVDGSSCSVADSFICLTPNQTATVLASDIDPGTTGYLVAVAVNAAGCPINFNHLIGDEFVKLASGHQSNLGAESIAAIAGGLPACNPLTDNNAVLAFNNVSYNALPRVLASSNIPSRGDGNDTYVVINRIGGNLSTAASTIGGLFGILYDDAEAAYSFSLPASACQSAGSITNDRPRVVPRFETVISSGRSGWFKVWGASDIGILGAQINRNANAATNAGAFNHGHNLHKLTYTTTSTVTIPIFPPNC